MLKSLIRHRLHFIAVGAIASVFAMTVSMVLWSVPGWALTPQEVPNPQLSGGWVTDMANIITPETEARLNQRISALDAYNGSQIVVVTVLQTRPSATPKVFATELFNLWGIGQAGEDNGVLFLVSIGDRRTEIETGYGIEGVLPDAQVGRILDEAVIPQFRQENYDRGIEQGTEALVARLMEVEPGGFGRARAVGMVRRFATNFDLLAGIAGIGIAIAGLGTAKKRRGQPVLLDAQGYSRETGFDKHDQTLRWLSTLGCSGIALTLLSAGLANTGLPIAILLIGAVIFTFPLSIIINRFWLDPDRRSRTIRPWHCKRCQTPLTQLDVSQLETHLTKSEKVAKDLRNTVYEGWTCDRCYPEGPKLAARRPRQIPQGMHLRAYVTGSASLECPTCREITMTSTSRVIRHPTEYSTGERLVTKTCKCCGNVTQTTEIIPRVQKSSSGGSGSSGGSSSGSSGGGSSGGGGAGRGW